MITQQPYGKPTCHQCTPRRKLWNPRTPGHCRSEYTRGVYSGSINVISDFVILILPLPIIIGLQRPSVKKIRPLLVFAEIAIGIIVGCMPLVHKFFRHIFSEISVTSSFKLFSSSTGSSVWRRLLSRPSTSEDGDSRGKLFGSKDSGSVAPQIQSLNMTRASLSFVELEKDLPALPAPTHITEEIVRKPVPRRHDERVPRDMLDIERQAQSQSPVGRDREKVLSHQSIGTRRAQYELYSSI
ncbi:MAG: hypothetical protein LQ352_005374 [Teloschistes flavicans]|nr:MAG: hypothetical protein LQ352_005374 [Teloschistes flavicans]